MSPPRFHPLVPGCRLPDDWFDGAVPANVEVGEDCVLDSSFTFKHFFAEQPAALRLGDRVTLWRTSLSLEPGAEVAIGSDCYLTNASLVCSRRIEIGERVFIAGGATIADSDFHPVAPLARFADTVAMSPRGDRTRRPPIEATPVRIGDDVWIGFNAAVLRGVTVGDGATIAPGAVVLADVAPGATVEGNPARVV